MTAGSMYAAPPSATSVLTTAPPSTNRAGMVSTEALTGSAGAAWPTANTALFKRFWLPTAATARYVCIKLAVSSGNYQLGVVKLSGVGAVDYTRVMNSGVVAAPTAGDLRVDLGATLLEAGDYAVFMWADNTTIQVPNGATTQYAARRIIATVAGLAGGVTASGTLAWSGTRGIDIYLEGDV